MHNVVWGCTEILPKFSQKRSSFCTLFKVMCFKLKWKSLTFFFLTWIASNRYVFKQSKTSTTRCKWSLFRLENTLCYPCVILLMKGVFIQTSCLLSGLVRLIVFHTWLTLRSVDLLGSRLYQAFILIPRILFKFHLFSELSFWRIDCRLTYQRIYCSV